MDIKSADQGCNSNARKTGSFHDNLADQWVTGGESVFNVFQVYDRHYLGMEGIDTDRDRERLNSIYDRLCAGDSFQAAMVATPTRQPAIWHNDDMANLACAPTVPLEKVAINHDSRADAVTDIDYHQVAFRSITLQAGIL